jgi:hypothetical protein
MPESGADLTTFQKLSNLALVALISMPSLKGQPVSILRCMRQILPGQNLTTFQKLSNLRLFQLRVPFQPLGLNLTGQQNFQTINVFKLNLDVSSLEH